MNFRECLYALGVREETLTEAEKQHLEQEGYLALPNILTPERAAQFGARLDELLRLEGERAGSETHTEAGSDRLSDLVNKDPRFEICFTHPRVLAAIAHVIRGEFKLSSINSRFARPGQGLQGLHADWEEPVEPGDYCVCNSIWLLDDFTEENGATRIVPGSHRSRKLPQTDLPNPNAPYPGEVKIIAPAGTVVVFNSHVWHGGTLNRTQQPRRAMHAYFCRRDLPPQTDQSQYLRLETSARLSEAARYMLDV
jgi:ectoine hydroxylase-related dioxygenase (phytanoyl-CoA dioxygenase family)